MNHQKYVTIYMKDDIVNTLGIGFKAHLFPIPRLIIQIEGGEYNGI
jgi:hypothetical protein